jgi:hypothetical protein
MSAAEVETLGEDESRTAKLLETSAVPIVSCVSMMDKGLGRNL